MKAQTLFLAASAIIGALAAPVQRREAQPDVITVYENVVHVVTTTSTVWVPPSTPTPTPAPEKKVEEVKEEPEEVEEPVEEPEEVEVKKPSPTPTPTPTPSPKSEPTTTSVYIPPTTTKAQPTQAPAAPEPEQKAEEVEASTPDQQETTTGGAGAHTGDGTYYTPAMGSCGSDEHTEADLVAALPKAIMEASEIGGNPNNNPLCGKSVEVTRGSKKVKVIVVDKCMGCAPDDIDLSPAAFNQLGAASEGRITVSWRIL